MLDDLRPMCLVYSMKNLSFLKSGLFALLLVIYTGVAFAEERRYGSFIYNSKIPNALFFMSLINNGDDFELRKALRNHEIDTIVLASPGGSVWAGLSMAGIIFDKKLRVYVPPKGVCASACSFMFFGGNERLNHGKLGVHQFASPDASKKELAGKTQAQSQFTVSEIIGFLNEFNTPRFVLERMFEDRQMYWFNDEETDQLNSKEFTLNQATQSSISGYIAEKIDAAAKEPARPDYSAEELITSIQERLNEIGCSAGVADGIWGHRTNAAAVLFASTVGLPTSQKDLISEAFLNALSNAKEGACPKSIVFRSFFQSYTLSCSNPVNLSKAKPARLNNVVYNRSNGIGSFRIKWKDRAAKRVNFKKVSNKSISIKFVEGALQSSLVIDNSGKVISFSWRPHVQKYCKKYTARAR